MTTARVCIYVPSLLLVISTELQAAERPSPAPAPATQLSAWRIAYGTDVPGAMSAQMLLDAPAGKDGFVTARDEHFYAGNTNRRMRFWGVNMCFTGAFPTHDQAEAVANRLARFGINAVRFHHMDRDPWPRGIFADAKLETLSPEALERLDYFIAALKSRGIYTNLNLHVSRSWARAHQWENADKLPIFDKMVDLFHPELISAQKAYARDLLGHVNAYTKTRYVDEPAVAMVEITNEDTFFTYGGEPKARNLPDPYGGMLQKLFDEWLANHQRSRSDEAWYEFLASVEEKFFTQMRRYLKDELGVKCPITGTIVLGPCGWPGQAQMDFIDTHTYWDHPTFPHKQWDMKDWLIKNTAMVDDPRNSVLRWSAARLRGKPFAMTEVNSNAPNEWQACGIPMVAAHAAMQDWDAVFIFDYVGTDAFAKDHIGGFFEIEGNPVQMAALPMAARIFLGGAVAPLSAKRIGRVDDPQSIYRTGKRFYSDLPAFAREIEGIDDQAILSARIYSTLDRQPPPATSTTREAEPSVGWTTEGPGTYTGRYVVVAPRAAMFAGFARGPMPIDLGEVAIEKLETPFATIIVTPADPASPSMRDADRLLLVALARQSNTDMGWDEPRRTLADHWGHAPVLIEPVKATVRFKRPGWKIVPLDAAGKPKPQPVTNLGDDATLWYLCIRQ